MTTVHKEENTDQLTDNCNEPEDIEKKTFSEKKISNKMSRKYPWKRKLFLLFVWGTFISVAFLLYPFLRSQPVSPVLTSVKWFPVQNDRSIRFKPFIIPFEEHGKSTYISLSISFELPNKELMNEMIKKNTRIRGIIYSILSENINILKNVSSLEKLKELITHGVNGVLTAGKVNEPIITDFSTV
jgi:flagellar basal body-associated protein FliL